MGTRFQDDQLAQLDAWIENHPDSPSRPEAIRQLVELGLAADEAGWRPEEEPEGEEQP